MAKEENNLSISDHERKKFAKKDMVFLAKHVRERDPFIANVQKVTGLHFHQLEPQVFQLHAKKGAPVFLSGAYIPKESPLLPPIPKDKIKKGYMREFTLDLSSKNTNIQRLLRGLNNTFDQSILLGPVSQTYLYCLKDFIVLPVNKRNFIPLKEIKWSDLIIMLEFSREIRAEKRRGEILNELKRRLKECPDSKLEMASIKHFITTYIERSEEHLRSVADYILES